MAKISYTKEGQAIIVPTTIKEKMEQANREIRSQKDSVTGKKLEPLQLGVKIGYVRRDLDGKQANASYNSKKDGKGNNAGSSKKGGNRTSTNYTAAQKIAYYTEKLNLESTSEQDRERAKKRLSELKST